MDEKVQYSLCRRVLHLWRFTAFPRELASFGEKLQKLLWHRAYIFYYVFLGIWSEVVLAKDLIVLSGYGFFETSQQSNSSEMVCTVMWFCDPRAAQLPLIFVPCHLPSYAIIWRRPPLMFQWTLLVSSGSIFFRKSFSPREKNKSVLDVGFAGIVSFQAKFLDLSHQVVALPSLLLHNALFLLYQWNGSLEKVGSLLLYFTFSPTSSKLSDP